jgi:hypothetical protein
VLRAKCVPCVRVVLSGLLDGAGTHPRLGLSVARVLPQAPFRRPSGGAGGSRFAAGGRAFGKTRQQLANEDVSPPAAFGCGPVPIDARQAPPRKSPASQFGRRFYRA